MNRYYKKFLLLILSLIFCGVTSAPVLCQEKENIPVSSLMGKTLKKMALNGKEDIDENIIEYSLLSANERGEETDPVYALLYMNVEKIDKVAGKKLFNDDVYKGSGTVLYRSGDYILVLTAGHNLYQDISDIEASKTAMLSLVLDSKNPKDNGVILAEMKDDSYIQIGKKDIALVAMKLNHDIFEKDKAIFDILDFKNIKPKGKNNTINATINQYPSFFSEYVKISGLAYHENDIGYHYIPSLPGSSGAAVIIDGKIAGVHTMSGKKLSKDEINIKYNQNNILVENNYFELMSLNEIKQENAKLKNSKDKAMLASLIQKYIDVLSKTYDCPK